MDLLNKALNFKMARSLQCSTGIAMESIRGIRVSEPEYNEAKDILESKFSDRRRQLPAYMDQLENMA